MPLQSVTGALHTLKICLTAFFLHWSSKVLVFHSIILSSVCESFWVCFWEYFFTLLLTKLECDCKINLPVEREREKERERSVRVVVVHSLARSTNSPVLFECVFMHQIFRADLLAFLSPTKFSFFPLLLLCKVNYFSKYFFSN